MELTKIKETLKIQHINAAGKKYSCNLKKKLCDKYFQSKLLPFAAFENKISQVSLTFSKYSPELLYKHKELIILILGITTKLKKNRRDDYTINFQAPITYFLSSLLFLKYLYSQK